MSKEQIFTHVLLKTEIAYALTGLVKAGKLGMYLVDGALLINEEADFAGKPDGMFIANEAIQTNRIRLVEGLEEGYLEVEGAPEMVLEVISSSSEHKDKVVLRQAYWQAGIREYWLVDARRQPLSFDILRHTSRGYTATRKSQGWVRSAVFGRGFRLLAGTTPQGHPAYTLEIRPSSPTENGP
jgi:Uma2 family endonuclease